MSLKSLLVRPILREWIGAALGLRERPAPEDILIVAIDQ